MRRREFLGLVARGAVVGVIGCAGELDPGAGSSPGAPDAAGAPPPPGSPDATGAPPDAAPACDAGFALLHDTYARALYLDGSLGPLTGIIYVDDMIAGVEIELDFWHGHGGQLHRFTITPGDFAALLRGERVDLMTTIVEDHQHQLFIDPVDPAYQVEGSTPVPVPHPCP